MHRTVKKNQTLNFSQIIVYFCCWMQKLSACVLRDRIWKSVLKFLKCYIWNNATCKSKVIDLPVFILPVSVI